MIPSTSPIVPMITGILGTTLLCIVNSIPPHIQYLSFISLKFYSEQQVRLEY